MFESRPLGHGGERRSAQISGLLREIDVVPVKIPTGYTRNLFRRECVWNFFVLIVNYLRLSFVLRRFLSVPRIIKKLKWASRLNGLFRTDKGAGGILLYETSQFELAPVVTFYKKQGYSLIGFPHNMESLVPSQRSRLTGRRSPGWIQEEIRFLKLFDIVFAISKEETLLLKQFGVNARYLPYYPVKETMQLLLKIRTGRQNRQNEAGSRKQVLMIGSALNSPTREGIVDRIGFFNNNPDLSYHVKIIGYQTETLSRYTGNTKQIEILGSVSQETLEKHLMDADMVLIHQPATSGALTRIIESLICGIPVIGNFSSCRNYHGMDGVYSYEDDHELIDFLSMDPLPVPTIPEFPTKELRSFQQILQQIAYPVTAQ